MNTVWVGNIPGHADESKIWKVFERECGPVLEVRLVRGHKGEEDQMMAFVQFKDPLGFENALKMKDCNPFGGSTPIKVNFAKGAPLGQQWDRMGKGSGKSGGGKSKGGGDNWSSGGWSDGGHDKGWSSDKGGGWYRKQDNWWQDGKRGGSGNSWWSGDYENGGGESWGRSKGSGKRNDGPPVPGDTRLWVGGLPLNIREDKIRQEFESCGEVENVKMVIRDDQKFPYCFITFASGTDVERIMREKQGNKAFGGPIKINWCSGPPPPKDGAWKGKREHDDRDEAPRGGTMIRLRSRSRSPRRTNDEDDFQDQRQVRRVKVARSDDERDDGNGPERRRKVVRPDNRDERDRDSPVQPRRGATREARQAGKDDDMAEEEDEKELGYGAAVRQGYGYGAGAESASSSLEDDSEEEESGSSDDEEHDVQPPARGKEAPERREHREDASMRKGPSEKPAASRGERRGEGRGNARAEGKVARAAATTDDAAKPAARTARVASELADPQQKKRRKRRDGGDAPAKDTRRRDPAEERRRASAAALAAAEAEDSDRRRAAAAAEAAADAEDLRRAAAAAAAAEAALEEPKGRPQREGRASRQERGGQNAQAEASACETESAVDRRRGSDADGGRRSRRERQEEQPQAEPERPPVERRDRRGDEDARRGGASTRTAEANRPGNTRRGDRGGDRGEAAKETRDSRREEPRGDGRGEGRQAGRGEAGREAGRDRDGGREGRDAGRDTGRGGGEARGEQRRERRGSRERGDAKPVAAKRDASPHVLRVDNLPDDMAHDEFKATVQDFGEVLSVRLEKAEKDGDGKVGTVHFKNSADVPRALRKLHRRRVEGWEKRLAASIADA